MKDAPTAKRRRTDSNMDEAQPSPLVRSTEYWFDDGNIILQVESSQFRIAKSVLSRDSSVFRDLFTLPLPADEPTIEGCPIVVLSGDTAQDWTLFWGVIYPKSYLGEPPRLSLLSAMLRLSKKYDFPLFREDCVRRLKGEFPTTLQGFDSVASQWTFFYNEPGNQYTCVDVLALSRELGLHSVLPALYAGILRAGACMLKVLDINDKSLHINDRLAVLLGHANLLKLQSTTTLSWLNFDAKPPHIPLEDCSSPKRCTDALKAISREISFPHPKICIFRAWDVKWQANLCKPCRNKAKEVFAAGRETCWQQLPAAFGLPSWEDLKALDFE
ncbi:hypothetical protein C8R46DRAFT_934918 [Mycena filopes]|nr:hypothetical protein C8R46DRAFT_934918 [Mycena filopes]